MYPLPIDQFRIEPLRIDPLRIDWPRVEPLRVALGSILFATILNISSHADARDSVRTSAQVSVASMLGSAIVSVASYKAVESVAASGGRLVVTALEPVGDSVRITLKGTDQSVQASASASITVARDASVAVGTVVSATAHATGYALVAAGRIIAFIPNELGRALLRQEPSRYAVAGGR